MFEEESVGGRILLAAKELFAEKGHEETTLREIAAKAKTSESQIVKYFKSKAGVLDALLDMARAFIDGQLDQILKQTNDPVVVLEKVSTLLVDLYQRDVQLLSIYLFSRRYYTQVSPQEFLIGARFRKLLAGVFSKGQKENVFRGDFNPDAAASAFWGAIQGMIRDELYAERIAEFPKFSFEEMAMVLRAIVRSFARGK